MDKQHKSREMRALYEDIQHNFPRVLRPGSAQEFSTDPSAIRSEELQRILLEAGRAEEPVHPVMADVQQRVETLQGWPGRVDIARMAEAGFFFQGSGRPEQGSGGQRSDGVTCFHCGGMIMDWADPSDPWHRHGELFPSCRHVTRRRSLRWKRGILTTMPRTRSFSE